MYDEEEVAFRYRRRAEEVRTLADNTHDIMARHLLLDLASHYELAVETLHHIAATEREVRSRIAKIEANPRPT